MTTTVKVLTLNSWAIALPWPFGSKDRRFRISAIADALAAGDYDIVALQEVWSVSDYEIIKDRVAEVLPDSFYFHSGWIGSGLCVFTKGIICGTMMHRYSLNGYPHHVHRGDWFGGKTVGLVRVKLNDLCIDVYATHLHAEYDKDNDLYLPHRVLQAYELSQFINETTRGDMALVVGDLNLEPMDFGYQLILSSACLTDAYAASKNSYPRDSDDPLEGMTCEVPTNSYVSQISLKRWPHGKRIDYVLYRANEGLNITARQCCTALGRIPSTPSLNYSDHEAVTAVLEITHDSRKHDWKTADFPDQAIKLIEMGITTSKKTRRMSAIILVILLALFLLTINIEMICLNRIFTFAALVSRFALTLAIGFFFIYGLVALKMEQKALEAAKSGMLVLKKTRNIKPCTNP